MSTSPSDKAPIISSRRTISSSTTISDGLEGELDKQDDDDATLSLRHHGHNTSSLSTIPEIQTRHIKQDSLVIAGGGPKGGDDVYQPSCDVLTTTTATTATNGMVPMELFNQACNEMRASMREIKSEMTAMATDLAWTKGKLAASEEANAKLISQVRSMACEQAAATARAILTKSTLLVTAPVDKLKEQMSHQLAMERQNTSKLIDDTKTALQAELNDHREWVRENLTRVASGFSKAKAITDDLTAIIQQIQGKHDALLTQLVTASNNNNMAKATHSKSRSKARGSSSKEQTTTTTTSTTCRGGVAMAMEAEATAYDHYQQIQHQVSKHLSAITTGKDPKAAGTDQHDSSMTAATTNDAGDKQLPADNEGHSSANQCPDKKNNGDDANDPSSTIIPDNNVLKDLLQKQHLAKKNWHHHIATVGLVDRSMEQLYDVIVKATSDLTDEMNHLKAKQSTDMHALRRDIFDKLNIILKGGYPGPLAKMQGPSHDGGSVCIHKKSSTRTKTIAALHWRTPSVIIEGRPPTTR